MSSCDSSKACRPLSPHLTIYRPQISSVLSILHRITGLVNYIGLVLLVTWLICSLYFAPLDGSDAPTWAFFTTTFGRLFLIAWTFSLYYHFCAGIRHLFWDAGKGFSIEVMNITGWAVIIASILLTIISWLLAFY